MQGLPLQRPQEMHGKSPSRLPWRGSGLRSERECGAGSKWWHRYGVCGAGTECVAQVWGAWRRCGVCGAGVGRVMQVWGVCGAGVWCV